MGACIAHGPPKGKEHMMFVAIDEETSVTEVLATFGKQHNPEEFQYLMVRPSRSGAHICFLEGHELLFKVRMCMTHDHEEIARFNVYNANKKGRAAAIECGHIEKGHMTLSAQPGVFNMEQSWHVETRKLELQPRIGVLHRKQIKMLPTPVEACSCSVTYSTSGTRDMKAKTEKWQMTAGVDSPNITMKADQVSVNTLDGFHVMRVFSDNNVICSACRQTFEHTGLRGVHERPFIGVRLKAKENDLRAGWKQQPFHPLGCGPEVLPLLLILAWAEEVMYPPEDLRDHFIDVMRSTTDKLVSSWSSDDGTLTEGPAQSDGSI